ncbi:MAG: bifunctional 4-hydroxy-2-oxoglutarate aldolase/2-dehydro-3-deoxy-phosphogluconate aldolase [Lachnospiraceae bacterium]|nr:bifunctional 4-hydroxy-2-oxoglutarate aldolase/2-dehydro-3-deoxy-phosphogluconate aldolase [Lachnospiraceae bacterium]
MNELLQKIHDIGIVPVIAIDEASKAVPLAKALVKGGLSAAEVTFRTAAAEDAIKAIVKEVPEMIVGAGTVLTTEQADRAIAAGVSFIVSPGFNPKVTGYVISKGVCMMPGTATAGEMEQAMAMGLEVVKFFPAEQNGGIEKLKALAGPYKTLKWMPTGGVNTENLSKYMSFPQILACGGTWMVKKDLIENEKWDEITSICEAAVRNMLGFRLRHIGINCEDAGEAQRTAKTLSALFGFEYDENDKGIFVGKEFAEVMKYNGRGRCGHIGITTNDVDRAVYHLLRKGATFDESSRLVDEKGTKFIYLNGDFSGFEIHLSRA